MKETMSGSLSRTMDQLESIQNAREQLLKACAEYEASILVNCPMEQYDELFDDYEAISGAVSRLLNLGAIQAREVVKAVEL